ncbi:hypothetical protein FACS1894158_05220 [Betaproteobacteria bacterium]|nr:hypothetical protein FACS1894158_05220 [Betaproteobacteria bacterium]
MGKKAGLGWDVDHEHDAAKFAANVLSFAYEGLESLPPGLVRILTTIRPFTLYPDTTENSTLNAQWDIDWSVRLFAGTNPHVMVHEVGHGVANIIGNYRENFYEEWIAFNRGAPYNTDFKSAYPKLPKNQQGYFYSDYASFNHTEDIAETFVLLYYDDVGPPYSDTLIAKGNIWKVLSRNYSIWIRTR